MVSCKHCATPNSLDSTFCKKCGTPLADEDIKEAEAKLETLIGEGVTLYNAGRFDDAMEIAEAAVMTNPSSPQALSLKGDCHAHRGEVAEAIECYEKVVELNPDSALDKLRLNQLRNQLVLQVNPPQPDRRLAVVGGLATVVLVMCIAAIAARMNGQANAKAEVAMSSKLPDSNQPQSEFYGNQTPQTQSTPNTQTTPQTNQQDTNPNATNSQEQGNSTPSSGTGTGTGLRPYRGDTLPDVNGGIGGSEVGIEPVNPPGPKTNSGNGSGSGTDTTSKTRPDDPPVEKTTPPVQPKEDPGMINIEVRRSSNNLPGGASSTDSMSASTLVRVARQQFQVGNYSGAASAFERALANGADPISINQRLGQAYERLGRSGDAVAAYNRAITAAGAAINSGRGDREHLTTIQDSCKQALKVLQGG